MNARLEFWKNSTGWPRDPISYVFLARAVHTIGKSMFGLEWTGDEPCLDLMQVLPTFPIRSGGSAYFAHELLIKHYPEFNRQPLKWPPVGSSFGLLPPSVDFTLEEWDAARAIVAKDHEQKMPGLRRFSQVQDRIVQLAEAELLITAVREKAGGDPTPIPRSWWNSERISNRFDFCQMNPEDRFGIGSAGDRYQWIFVTRESLISCSGDTSTSHYDEQRPGAVATTSPAAPLRSEDQAKPRRRVAGAKIEPEFKLWREQQVGGYIPTEAEDVAHMKQLGVGRDTVRTLRKKFPTRERGQKKSG
jgi:hypothetical protein